MVSHKENEALRKIREDKCEQDGCQMEDTGVCALHDIEVERRAGMKELVDKIPSILTKLNIIIGTTGLVGMIIIASFAYTTMVKVDLRQDILMYRQEQRTSVAELRGVVHDLAITQSLNVQSQKAQVEQLERLNNSFAKIIERQVIYEDSVNSRIDNRFDNWGPKNENK